MKQLTMEQLTHRMGSLAEGQSLPHVIGAALNVVISCIKITDDPNIMQATGATLLEMLDVLEEKHTVAQATNEPKIQLQ